MKNFCVPRPGQGLVVILHNLGTTISGTSGGHHGSAGLSNVVAIELDLMPGEGEFIKPHVSIEFNDASALSDKHGDTLAVAHLTNDVADGKLHKMRVVYERNAISAKKGPQKAFQVGLVPLMTQK